MEGFNFIQNPKLQGEEVLATYFFPEAEDIMLMALGENVNGEKEGPAFVYLYMFEDGEVNYGIDTFVFLDRERMKEFIKKLPTMSAMDYLMQSIACPPTID